MEGDAKLRETNECLPDELAKLTAAVKMFDECSGKAKPAPRWVFPLANIPPELAIGGNGGSGFVRNPGIKCFVTPGAGHPAHDLFVDDRRQISRDAQGNPFPTLAIEDGWVMVARDGWKPEDRSRGGNYVMLYLPGRRSVAYYAHLDEIFVKPGDRVVAGQLLGTIGRTGKNAVPRRSQTHLHFGLWEAKTFRPYDSFALLRAARTLSAKVPTSEPKAEPAASAPR